MGRSRGSTGKKKKKKKKKNGLSVVVDYFNLSDHVPVKFEFYLEVSRSKFAYLHYLNLYAFAFS